MKNENELLLDEWFQYAKDDLESAKIILEESDNYHISVYHSHQTIEKIFKWYLLKNNKKFLFIHDLKAFFKLVNEIKNIEPLLEEISFIDDLYPQLRYPTGEKVSKEEAEKALQIAQKIFKLITESK